MENQLQNKTRRPVFVLKDVERELKEFVQRFEARRPVIEALKQKIFGHGKHNSLIKKKRPTATTNAIEFSEYEAPTTSPDMDAPLTYSASPSSTVCSDEEVCWNEAAADEWMLPPPLLGVMAQ
eukprot:Platyproteum_vivax@DN9229_c0_g1_i1.p1